MMMTSLHRFVLAPAFAVVAFAFTFVPATMATLVLDNTSFVSGNTRFVGNGGALAAQSFQTSAGLWELNSVTLDLENIFGGGGFSVSIFGNSGSNTPGSLVGTLSGASPVNRGLYTYTASSPLSLDGSTRYWIVASATAGNGYSLYITTGNATTTAIWSIPSGSSLRSMNNGASWSQEGEGAFRPNYAFSINATSAAAVPEPGTWAAAALLAGGAAFMRWRKRGKGEAQLA